MGFASTTASEAWEAWTHSVEVDEGVVCEDAPAQSCKCRAGVGGKQPFLIVPLFFAVAWASPQVANSSPMRVTRIFPRATATSYVKVSTKVRVARKKYSLNAPSSVNIVERVYAGALEDALVGKNA